MNDRQSSNLEVPIVPDLTEFDEIDLEKLGSADLVAVIKYTGMQKGDLVSPRWVGSSPAGEAFDDVGATVPVREGDLERGLEVTIANSTITSAAGGWAFFSYTQAGRESLRQFCYVGLRTRGQDERLPVMQAIQSQGLIIQPDTLDATGVRFLVPPYQAMQVGDKVTLTVVSYDEEGDEDDEERKVLTVTQEHLDKAALSHDVRRTFFRFIDPGHVQASYEIEFVDGERIGSPVQRLAVDSTAMLPPPLGKPVIDGHEEGDPLDPAQFRNGLVVRVPIYDEMAVSDRIVLRWRSPARDYLQTLRVDPSTVASQSIAFQVDFAVLAESQGATVEVSYLFGREGAGLRSEALRLEVVMARQLEALLVNRATADKTPNWGTLAADDTLSGVYVDVPPGVVQPGEALHVHWWGISPLGQYIAEEPASPDNPLRFHIPPEYVPANMGRGEKDESRRFPVFYRLVSAKGHVDSEHFFLRIKPEPAQYHPQVTCEQAESLSLSLAAVPAAGADLSLGTWSFIAEGQLLTLSIGRGSGPGSWEEAIRDALPVTAQEVTAGVKAKLAKSLLEKVPLGDTFTLYARASFDGGDFFTEFKSKSLQLVP